MRCSGSTLFSNTISIHINIEIAPLTVIQKSIYTGFKLVGGGVGMGGEWVGKGLGRNSLQGLFSGEMVRDLLIFLPKFSLKLA